MHRQNKFNYNKSMLRIKELLKEKGVTAKQLAEKLGKSESSVSLTIKNGNPTADTLEKIAVALGCDVSELFESTSNKKSVTCPNCGCRLDISIKQSE